MINQNLLLTGDAGYNLTKSLRFRSGANAYLSRSPSTTTSTRTAWTWSGWVKLGQFTATVAYNTVFSTGTSAYNYMSVNFTNCTANDQIVINADGYQKYYTNAVFRDPAAWYHVVVAFNSNASAGSRIIIYINGVQQTTVVNNEISSGFSSPFGVTTNPMYVGRHGADAGWSSFYYSDFYLTEINWIDGQVLTPSSFGQTSPSTGVWIPKKYVGTYGTNGFYLPFTNTASTSTLGNDFSGNSNTWTVNNISLTSGSTYDSMNDVPTNTNSNTANYATLNPLLSYTGLAPSAGNLQYTANSENWRSSTSTISASSGKWYAEVNCVSLGSGGGIAIGIVGITDGPTISNIISTDNNVIGRAGQVGYCYLMNGNKYTGGSSASYGASYTTGDTIGVALDLDAGTLTFYKNGASQGTAFTSISGTFAFGVSVATPGTTTVALNCGQRPFSYTPPTGFVALNTFNLPTPTIGATASTIANEYFDATLYTGNGSTQTITNSGSMQPDFVWVKSRSTAVAHALVDSVRGVDKYLYSSLTIAEETQTTALSSFNSNGFSLAGSFGNVNTNGTTYVAWQWRASNATAVTNTAGSITSTVSANTTAGFSVVTWVHSSTTSTIGHGLGVAPTFVIVKSRTTAYNWDVGCTSIGWGNRLNLNTTDAAYSPAFWNSTAPTSTVFTYAGSGATNGDNMVAYCFAPVAGYSAFGSYTGNGSSDGPFVYTGFRPRFVMFKNRTQGSQWILLDTAINTYNVSNAYLEPNTADTQNTANTVLDILSNGFKLRNTGGTDYNESNNIYIYACFAENPFKYANAR